MIVLDVVLSRMTKALSSLNVKAVDFADYSDKEGNKPEILLRVVSDEFENIRNKNRNKVVHETLMKQELDLYNMFDIDCECLTTREYRMVLLKRTQYH